MPHCAPNVSQTWIALLRGINVGGKNKILMKDLRTALQDAGLSDVKTYIQSGNCVFRASQSATDLTKLIASTVKQNFNLTPTILTIPESALKTALTTNPFQNAADDPKSLHLYFLAEAPKSPDLAALESLKHSSENFSLQGQVFYLHSPEGIARSKLAANVEKHLNVPATARNLRSAQNIAALAKTL